MPVYRIHRLKDTHQEQYRWSPHTPGPAQVKPKDYQPAGEIEAASLYSAWARLREEGKPLRVGDLLEVETGELRICKYVGFEEAHWVLPEPQPPAGPSPASISESSEGSPSG
jgi:hypothetical protein